MLTVLGPRNMPNRRSFAKGAQSPTTMSRIRKGFFSGQLPSEVGRGISGCGQLENGKPRLAVACTRQRWTSLI